MLFAIRVKESILFSFVCCFFCYYVGADVVLLPIMYLLYGVPYNNGIFMSKMAQIVYIRRVAIGIKRWMFYPAGKKVVDVFLGRKIHFNQRAFNAILFY